MAGRRMGARSAGGSGICEWQSKAEGMQEQQYIMSIAGRRLLQGTGGSSICMSRRVLYKKCWRQQYM
jgi:hypothetical protein